MPSRGSGVSRETRLLAATIGVSLVVLLILSRFRFPETSPESRDGASAQPLTRLAARAAFDDLSLAVRELSSRVNSSLLVVRATVPTSGTPEARLALPDGTRLLPALRVRDDAAVALIGEGAVVDSVIGVPTPVHVLAHDPVRGIALVRVPPAQAPVLSIREGQLPLNAPGYVAVAEASAAGTSLRPVFVGRSDGIGDPRWDPPLLTMGRSAAADLGAPVFTLDGRLAGLLTSTDGETALVPAAVVLATVDQLLLAGGVRSGDIGIVTQAVDPWLEAATGASDGAAVAAVAADGPAGLVILPGDVITAVNGQPVRTPDALRLRVSRAAPGTTLSLTVRRDGGLVTAPVTVRPSPATRSATEAAPEARAARESSASGERALGLTLRGVPGRGSEVVRVQPGSVAEAAGLRAGDVVVSLGRARTPAPDAITSAFAALPVGRAAFLSVERDGQPRLVALRR
jgi:serine protease Do